MKKIIIWIITLSFTMLMADGDYTLEKLNKEIKRSSKPTVVYFRKNSCASCEELEKYTLTDKKVKSLLENFTFLKIDVSDINRLEENKKMLKIFNIFGTPAMVFFDKKHIQQDEKLFGFQEATKFIGHLNRFLKNDKQINVAKLEKAKEETVNSKSSEEGES